ncbi:hypothetical protein GALMADRAFT_105927 [Galerina marginata CBS 339.88]|uniref:FHA domain-containing protein n=1 Tax=Galerina marginata (strain CBS 339.88) TaxID=685588 RepID=A0A067SHP9_GALM3|nr:hypothetical protein GALMADRAFT_105927 [Galerina marginata CBS 339.88]
MQLPISTSTNNVFSPAIYLFPVNDTWAPKCVAEQHTRIGRQTSTRTVPTEQNGIFSSKVLSRRHAEVWQENGKIYLKDTESANGTFINGHRLSGESLESEPFELKNEDVIDFGIDVVGDDKKTIIHRKISARVFIPAGDKEDVFLSRL